MRSGNKRIIDDTRLSGPAPAQTAPAKVVATPSPETAAHEQLVQELRARQHALELENAALRAQAAGFQRLVEQAPDLLYRFRLWPDAAFEYVSPGATALTGYTPEDHYADPALGFKLVHPDDHALLAQVTLGAQDSDEAAFEMRWVRKDGSLLYTDHHFSVIRDEQGRPIALEGIARDRTAAAHTQAALLERTAELQAERDFARQVMDALGQGLVISNGHYLEYANPFLARLLDTTPDNMAGRLLNDFIAPADLPKLQALMLAHRPEEAYQYEVLLQSAAGRIIPALVSSAPHWQAGAVVGRIALIADLTQIKAIETDLRRSRDELRAANVALEKAVLLKDEFLASMSHELRTPLTGILGLSEALQLQDFGTLNDRQLHALENIWNSGQHLLALINDILDIAKLEAAQLDLAYSQCDVRDLCRAGIALVKGMAQKKRQQITFTLDPDPISLYVDPRRMKQMLANLLGNAVKFTPATGALGLRVQGDAARQVVAFSVWDQGIGIAPDDLPRLFQPFVQLADSPSSEQSGTGLGLALVYRMAHLHGGTVEVASVPGEGSTFTLILPWRHAEPAPNPPSITRSPTHPLTPTTPAPGKPGAATPGDERPLLLLAEDNATSAEILAEYLALRGYAVAIAGDGLDAVHKALTLAPALILMDIRMPLLDGLQAIRQLRASGDPALATMPIIALTAQAMRDDAERCLAAGANYYIAKPYRFATVIAAIQAQLCPLSEGIRNT